MKKLVNEPMAVVGQMLEGLVALAPGQALFDEETVSAWAVDIDPCALVPHDPGHPKERSRGRPAPGRGTATHDGVAPSRRYTSVDTKCRLGVLCSTAWEA